eukprot:2499922-Rhodomonas_salina.2
MVLRTQQYKAEVWCYAPCGTKRAYGASRLSGASTPHTPRAVPTLSRYRTALSRLRYCHSAAYAMPGTAIARYAIGPMRCPVLPYLVMLSPYARPTQCPVLTWAMVLGASGTGACTPPRNPVLQVLSLTAL